MELNSALSYLIFILFTACMLALIFIALIAVGHKRNKAFQNATPEERAKLFDRDPQKNDVVLLSSGMRVTLEESQDGGQTFHARTVNDYGKQSDPITVARADIVKIEYFS